MGNRNNSGLYFAFGSNMLDARLRRRCPGARFRTLAAAHGHRVAFDKLSEDSSGKANLVSTNEPAAALGVVYEIPAAEVSALDAFEGPGYIRVDEFPVRCLDSNNVLHTSTYVARRNIRGLKPFDWYLALILAGMQQRGLTPDYVHAFRCAGFITDPELSRVTRLNAMQDLAAAGYGDYRELLGPGP